MFHLFWTEYVLKDGGECAYDEYKKFVASRNVLAIMNSSSFWLHVQAESGVTKVRGKPSRSFNSLRMHNQMNSPKAKQMMGKQR